MKLKKLGMMVLAGALGIMLTVGCANEEVTTEGAGDVQQEQGESGTNSDESPESSYSVERMEVEIEDGDSNVYYPKMTGYKGELTQDYINQSIENVKKYADKNRYSSAQIDYNVTRMDDEVLSIVFNGTAEPAGLGRKVNIMESVNIDVETSNEIRYENLVKDDEAMRKILAKKLKESETMEFEAEGIRVYFDNGNVVFFYMPLDDSSDEFIQISVPEEEIREILNDDFGEHPAS